MTHSIRGRLAVLPWRQPRLSVNVETPRKLNTIHGVCVVGIFLLVMALPAMGFTPGMVADNASSSVHVIDADTDTYIATIPLGSGDGVGDCAVTADGILGFVTNFQYEVWVIDLTTSPPSLAAGTNPIPISNPGEDLDITVDGQFLVVCDGAVQAPISVVNIATRSEVSTLSLELDCTSISVCDDGTSILATSAIAQKVYRITIDGAGNLTNTGEELVGEPAPINCYCAPGSQTGVVVDAFDRGVTSFSVPGLASIETRPLSGISGVSGAFNIAGDRFYVRSRNPGSLDAFDYDAATGTFSPGPVHTAGIVPGQPFYGMDQMSLNGDGSKLYLSQPGVLNIYDPATLAPAGSISDVAFHELTGVAFPAAGADETPPEITVELNRDVLWPPNHKLVEICATVTATDDVDPSPTVELTSITSNEPDDGVGDGNTKNDIQNADVGTADYKFDLRSERAGGGDGRCYTVTYTATDASGNFASASVCVRVPHDKGGSAMAGPGFTADGRDIDPWANNFMLVIPSSGGNARFDATDVDPADALIGNTLAAFRPDGSKIVDVNADGRNDLVLYFSPSAIAQLRIVPDGDRMGRRQGNGPIGLHYYANETDYLVRNIFSLGAPIVPGELRDPIVPRDQESQVEFGSIHPNPFNPTTTVAFELATAGEVRVRIYNARGQLVRTLEDAHLPAGMHQVVWNGTNDRGETVTSGIYFVRLTSGNAHKTRKIVMLK